MSIFQDKKNKKWGFRVYVYDKSSDSKKQFTRQGFLSKSEAQEKEASFIANKEYEKNAPTSFIQAYQDYLAYQKRLLKETTYKGYTYIHNKYILNQLKHITDIQNIGYREINLIYNQINNTDLTTEYKNKVMDHIKRMLKYFNVVYKYDNSYLKRLPPFRDDKPTDKKEKVIYSFDDFKKFISYVRDSKQEIIFKILFFTGIRIGELIGLKWGDVDFQESTITINRTISSKLGIGTYKEFTAKTKKGHRVIYIPQTLLNDLNNYRHETQAIQKHDYENLFIVGDKKPIGQNTVSRYCNQVSEHAGLPKITLHGFRHSYITYMIIELNVDPYILSEQVGHADITTTLNVYTHITKTKQKDTLKKAFISLNKAMK